MFETVTIYGSVFGTQGRSDRSDPAGIRMRPRLNACPCHQQVWQRADKNERASLETPYSHYKSMHECLFYAQGHLAP